MPDQNLNEMFNIPQPLTWGAKQLEAIDRCCDVHQRIVAVTGEAGTGKTSIIQEVNKRLTNHGYLCAASAPTGKAAKRIQEATGIGAQTNHRMLGYGMPFDKEITDDHTGAKETVRLSTGPRFTRENRMPYDVVLCDEYAMVNNEIHRNLIDALKNGGLIRVFGDINQLKPIEEDRSLDNEPSPFMQLLRKFDGIALDMPYRQGAGSGIVENGHRILAGRPLRKMDDFGVVMTDKPIDALRTLVMEGLEDGIDYSTVDHQIITCQNKSWIGTVKLNAVLQSIFWNHERTQLDLPRWKWDTRNAVYVQVGTKVVYTANSYDLNNGHSVFNGEVGTVIEIYHDGSLDIDFVDRVVTVPPFVAIETPRGFREFDPRCNIDLAYALTTHKMQGSECQHAVYIMNKSTIYGQSRRNFYTGVSRARKRCTVITDVSSMSKSLKFAG